MNFVPQPVIGLIQVHVCEDLRYGLHDPLQWPQILAPGYEFLAAVPRRDSARAAWSPMWWTPQDGDFEPLEGSIFRSLGHIALSSLDRLRPLVKSLSNEVAIHMAREGHSSRLHNLSREMTRAFERLEYLPSTFRDLRIQVRQVQRFWIMTKAYLEYADVVAAASAQVTGDFVPDTALMGGFTTDPELVQQLTHAGIPVWFLRPQGSMQKSHVQCVVLVQEPRPEEIVQQHWLADLPPIYSGLTGAKHIDSVSRAVLSYMDISESPLLVRYDASSLQQGAETPLPSNGGPSKLRSVPKKASKKPYDRVHPSHTRGRDKFVDVAHKWMPVQLVPWKNAMLSTDRSQPQRPAAEIWGYWIPDPALLLGCSSPERMYRYFSTWLRVRPAWLYLLSNGRSRPTRVATQWWRDFLNGDMPAMLENEASESAATTRRAKRLHGIREVFGAVLNINDYTPHDPYTRISWFEYHFSATQTSLCPFIIWEMYELGFRYELLALDRVLVPPRPDLNEADREELLARVFAQYDLYQLHSLPGTPVGLAARIPQARARTLEAMRCVLIRWPLCPANIRTAAPLTMATHPDMIKNVEQELADFYVHTFFEYSGRAPLVPHMLPSATS
ncbi:hypothetical protein C2E23DRAFT_722890 [Lenzites betulinus]|nr:hypothetical protein C2E23DRAFT_722890 [Lenzites betulinus]